MCEFSRFRPQGIKSNQPVHFHEHPSKNGKKEETGLTISTMFTFPEDRKSVEIHIRLMEWYDTLEEILHIEKNFSGLTDSRFRSFVVMRIKEKLALISERKDNDE